MWNKIWFKLNNTVAGGALIIAFFSFLSKLLGLFRERLIAHNFGASELSDIYYASFRLPDLIFNTLVLGALTSAFIPVFQKVWSKNKKEGLILANSVLNFFILLIGFLIIIAFIFTPQIVPFLFPGFNEWQLGQSIILTRVMLLSVIFFVASNIIGGVLNSWKKFFSFSLAACFYNIGIIIGIVYFYPLFGLIGLAYGVLIGAILHLLIQLPEVFKNNYRYSFVLKFNSSFKRILKLMIPRTIGLAASQINLVVITMIASTLAVGSIAIFNLANNLQSLPVSLFAVSLAVAVFPTFTQAINNNDKKLFAKNFSLSFRRILFLLLPISFLIIVLRAQIVRVILGTGAFDWNDTRYTAQTLGIFAISIFAQGLIPLLARSFYAFEDTKTPMTISVVSIIINIFLSFTLSEHLGVMGLALAFSISSILNMFMLYIAIYPKLKYVKHSHIFNSLVKITFNSLISGIIAYGALNILSPLVNMNTFIGIFTQGFVAGVLALLTYLFLSIVFKLEEVENIKKLFIKSLLLFKNGKK